MIEVILWNDDSYTSDKTLYVDPMDVSSMIRGENRRAYGGYQATTDLIMKDGREYKVCGHSIIKKVIEAQNGR